MNVDSWLKSSPIDRLDSELILASILKKDRVFLHAHPDYELDPNIIARANSLADRRAAHEPLAYILGEKEFYGRSFKVTQATLIPRPETEALINILKDLSPKKLIDIGTGSGCIAITAALELPGTQVDAVDISTDALSVARQNAERLGAKVNFFESDLLAGTSQKYDLIVANLPYVDPNWDWLSQEISYEPSSALYAEDSGLALIKELILTSPDFLNPGGKLLLEADRSQHQAIIEFAAKSFYSAADLSDQTLALCLCLR